MIDGNMITKRIYQSKTVRKEEKESLPSFYVSQDTLTSPMGSFFSEFRNEKLLGD